MFSRIGCASRMLMKYLRYNRAGKLSITLKVTSEGRSALIQRMPVSQSRIETMALVVALNLFKKSETEETPEGKLVMTIKRSILAMQRQQYDKAEEMLHVALRMAQDLQNKDGITYVYDVMANLAMEREQFKKAENLFVDVMRRLLADGYKEDNIKILHISSKIAHMSQLQGELEKAMQGFLWTIGKIEENIKNMPDDEDIRELLGLTKKWFGQLQMKLGNYNEAKKLFLESYQILCDIYGRINEEAITILNDLSVACVYVDDFTEAKRYLQQALEVVRELNFVAQEGLIKANLGIVYLREGLITQAKEICSLAWKIAKKSGNSEGVEQAEYCLNEIKSIIE